MKRMLIWMLSFVFILSMVGLALAQDTKPGRCSRRSSTDCQGHGGKDKGSDQDRKG